MILTTDAFASPNSENFLVLHICILHGLVIFKAGDFEASLANFNSLKAAAQAPAPAIQNITNTTLIIKSYMHINKYENTLK